MKKRLFRATERGTANYGWLKANYSFSFANYYDPEKIHFGALRVLNDDHIDAGAGFGEHPHDNMEIITIPLKGALKHRDSMSNAWIPLEVGEVQVMSAGTGIRHSEMNNSSEQALKLFQIWIMPSQKGVEPQYGQKRFSASDRNNKLQTLVSPVDAPIEGSLQIHQDAMISRLDLSSGSNFDYKLRSPVHGVFVMLVSGEISLERTELGPRDAIGIWDVPSFGLKAGSDAELLFIEVPMFF
jgi:redox-sensitive bicupin YhaK (pirin superfamily)